MAARKTKYIIIGHRSTSSNMVHVAVGLPGCVVLWCSKFTMVMWCWTVAVATQQLCSYLTPPPPSSHWLYGHTETKPEFQWLFKQIYRLDKNQSNIRYHIAQVYTCISRSSCMHLLVIAGLSMVGMSSICPPYNTPATGLTTHAVPAPNISSSCTTHRTSTRFKGMLWNCKCHVCIQYHWQGTYADQSS